jgi:hypothetical protein
MRERAEAPIHGLMSRLCRLDAAVGRELLCPGDSCPFWEPGGAVIAGRCAFEQLDLEGRPALVTELLRVRELLNVATAGEEERSARRLYHRLLNESGEE